MHCTDTHHLQCFRFLFVKFFLFFFTFLQLNISNLAAKAGTLNLLVHISIIIAQIRNLRVQCSQMMEIFVVVPVVHGEVTVSMHL